MVEAQRLEQTLQTQRLALDAQARYTVRVETFAWAAILAVAAVLRWWALGGRPLEPGESRIALEAWHVTQGLPLDLSAGSGLVYPTAIVFFLFGANDALARAIPALAGVLLVWLPFLFRQHFGHVGALCVAALLALSPTMVFASRYLGASSLALVIAIGCAVAIQRWLSSRKRWQLTVAAVGFGLLLTLGRFAYSILLLAAVLLLGAAAVIRWRDGRWPSLAPFSGLWPLGGIIALVTAILVSTGALSALMGLQQGLIDPLQAWLQGWGRGLPSLQLLLTYELPLIASAAISLLFPAKPNQQWLAGIGLGWLAMAIALLPLGLASEPDGIVLATAPLAALAGVALANALERLAGRLSLASFAGLGAIALPALALAWVVWSSYTLYGEQLAPTLRTLSTGPLGRLAAQFSVETVNAILLAFPAVMLLAAFAVAVTWLGARQTGYGVVGLLVVLALTFSLRTAWTLNLSPRLDQPEPILSVYTSPDVHNLETEIERNSAIMSTPGRRDLPMAVESTYRFPLAWYLREYTRVAYFTTTPTDDPIVIAREGIGMPLEGYVGRTYTILARQQIQQDTGLRPLWRWFFYRESRQAPTLTTATLYVRGQPR